MLHRRLLSRIMEADNGNIALSTAAALPFLMGAFGMATDYANLYLLKSRLQAAADGAAMAASREFGMTNKAQSKTIEATAAAYLDHELESQKKLGAFELTADVDHEKSTVTISLSLAWTPFFSHFIDGTVTPVIVGATAQFIGSRNLCVLTLDPKSTKALHLDKRAKISAKACTIYSDSAHRQAIRLDQDSSMVAAHICAVGGVQAKTDAVDPTPMTDCPVVPDPLAGRLAPEIKGCDYNKIKVVDQDVDLSPGVYCGGLTISGSSRATFSPGLYVIQDGPLAITGQAVVEGTGVGFFLTGDKAVLNIAGGDSIRLSGAEEGPLAGLLFFEDRSSPMGRVHNISSSSVREMTGTIYLPNGKLLVKPNAQVAEESAYTAIVTYQLELDEGPELVLNSDYGATTVPVPQGIKAAGEVVLTK